MSNEVQINASKNTKAYFVSMHLHTSISTLLEIFGYMCFNFVYAIFTISAVVITSKWIALVRLTQSHPVNVAYLTTTQSINAR